MVNGWWTKPLGNSRAWLQELLFPASCVICGREGLALCYACRQALPQRLKFFCPSCQQLQKVNHACQAQPIALNGLWFFGNYSKDFWQRLIAAFKYQFVRAAGQQAADELKAVLIENPFSFKDFIVVPIPLHPRRRLWRGFNQSLIIAQGLGLGEQVVDNLVSRRRYTRPQAKCAKEKRQRNIAGAFLLKDDFDWRGRDVLLVDDVYTTGSTMNELAGLLKERGAATVWGLVLAKG